MAFHRFHNCPRLDVPSVETSRLRPHQDKLIVRCNTRDGPPLGLGGRLKDALNGTFVAIQDHGKITSLDDHLVATGIKLNRIPCWQGGRWEYSSRVGSPWLVAYHSRLLSFWKRRPLINCEHPRHLWNPQACDVFRR